jgi:2-oxoglutarate ferredoxin oxidoreductase subunit beta
VVVEKQFEPPQPGRHTVLLLGNAGQRILTAGEILCLAGLTAGLHASQKNEYNITVLRGPSISELILSEEPIEYAGIERPEVILALSQEGVDRRRPLFTGLKPKTHVLQVPEVTLPVTKAAVSVIDLRSLEIKPQDWALAALAALAKTNRIISMDMLRAALTIRFRDDVLGAALQLIEKVYQE